MAMLPKGRIWHEKAQVGADDRVLLLRESLVALGDSYGIFFPQTMSSGFPTFVAARDLRKSIPGISPKICSRADRYRRDLRDWRGTLNRNNTMYPA